MKKQILNEIGSGCRDEEDLIMSFSKYSKENVLKNLHDLENKNRLNCQTTAGHTCYAKPGNEPWKETIKIEE